MARPDILADPTAELEAILNGTRGPGCLVDWLALHRHILAGGPLPAQWRGEGTAAGKLVGEVTDLRQALAGWSMTLQEYGAAMLERKDELGLVALRVAGED